MRGPYPIGIFILLAACSNGALPEAGVVDAVSPDEPADTDDGERDIAATTIIKNGTFEATPSLDKWTVLTSVAERKPVRSTVHRHRGQRSLRVGAVRSGADVAADNGAYQTFALPGGSGAILSFWTYTTASDTIDHDYQEAQLQDSSGKRLLSLLRAADNSARWTEHTMDLSTFAGQTVRVWFGAHTDGKGGTVAMWVDDVKVELYDGPPPVVDLDGDPPIAIVGQIFYRETRFSQWFYAHSNGDVNAPLARGDAVTHTTPTSAAALPGPYDGQGINCANCHFLNEHGTTRGGGMRAYADFAQRSAVPDRSDRGDTQKLTVRNAPTMVGVMRPHDGPSMLHLDGEFDTPEELARAGLTGRNMGWLIDERATAIANLARVIRGDDGSTSPAGLLTFGLPYKVILGGTDPRIPGMIRLGGTATIDVDSATDEQIFEAVATIMGAYLNTLSFAKTKFGVYNSSPYDAFMTKNHIAGRPGSGQSLDEYAKSVAAALDALPNPQLVEASEGAYQFHDDLTWGFGTAEVEGMRIFFGRGGCTGCHQPPDFTDFRFHNTGASQEEYDAVHGAGKFLALAIPTLSVRAGKPNTYLPATAAHPSAKGIFRSIPTTTDSRRADLGLWNIFANPDFALPQDSLMQILCTPGTPSCAEADLLPQTIAAFKTPGLRDLADSGPYLHTGRFVTLESTVQHYVDATALLNQGNLRNPDPLLSRVQITSADIAPLAAFLRALTEDYFD